MYNYRLLENNVSLESAGPAPTAHARHAAALRAGCACTRVRFFDFGRPRSVHAYYTHMGEMDKARDCADKQQHALEDKISKYLFNYSIYNHCNCVLVCNFILSSLYFNCLTKYFIDIQKN